MRRFNDEGGFVNKAAVLLIIALSFFAYSVPSTAAFPLPQTASTTYQNPVINRRFPRPRHFAERRYLLRLFHQQRRDQHPGSAVNGSRPLADRQGRAAPAARLGHSAFWLYMGTGRYQNQRRICDVFRGAFQQQQGRKTVHRHSHKRLLPPGRSSRETISRLSARSISAALSIRRRLPIWTALVTWYGKMMVTRQSSIHGCTFSA